MQFSVIQRILGLLLVIFSFTLIPPMIVSLLYTDGELVAFFYTFATALIVGLVLWLPTKNAKKELRPRDGFIIAFLFWSALGLFGSLPFMLAAMPHTSFTNAVFESISGLTTTGSTVFSGLDQFPKSILYYRQQLQWLGGMGIIVLAVAIMPMLGIGGMQLYRATTPGPIKDSRLTPRITETAKALWYIYLTLTIACATAYWFSGMDVFDAIAHSFATVSIGGFSTHDASLGYFSHQPSVEIVAIIFMLLSGANFALHFVVWRTRNLTYYFRDSEFKTYLAIMVLVASVATLYLYDMQTFFHLNRALLQGVFQTVSIATTTGFTTASYHAWPTFVPVLLILSSFVGACAGSTGGGMKTIRFLLIIKQGMSEVIRVIHPNAVVTVKLGGKPLPNHVISAVWGFFSAYVATFSIILLLLMLTGLDQVSAFSATAAALNNLGPGLNAVASSYAGVTDTAKWILIFAMLFGRLELFSLLVIFTPSFWRH
jgi:trk system potassium uptake protein TrkH